MLSALRIGRFYPPGNIPGTHFWVDSRAKGPMTPSGIEPATFRLEEQLRHRVPHNSCYGFKYCQTAPRAGVWAGKQTVLRFVRLTLPYLQGQTRSIDFISEFGVFVKSIWQAWGNHKYAEKFGLKHWSERLFENFQCRWEDSTLIDLKWFTVAIGQNRSAPVNTLMTN
jgi:hypothetical protein